MNGNNDWLRPEDYQEPACLLCGEPFGKESEIRAIPQQRIIEKLDEYMSRRDYPAVERHLLYWMQEAELGRDRRGRLMLLNELVGHYRKTGEKDKALARGREALALLESMDYEGSVTAGTTYVNVATACSAFGDNERALELFEKARAAYEANSGTRPHLLGGLYNNMALSAQALGRYGEAGRLYEKAMEQMGKVPGGVLEQAITCLNMADAAAAELGLEAAEQKIGALLDRAYELLHDSSAPHDGYYAFVCEKCAPSFAYYGYFLAAEELKREAEEIYDRP